MVLEWYSESPPRKSLSPATKKRYHEELEAAIAALSSHSSDSKLWDPIGKTPEEIAAWCADYECGHRSEMANCRRLGNAGICRATLMYLACTHVMLAAIRAMAASESVSTPQTLAHKRRKGYAPSIVAGGPDTTSSEDGQGTILDETGALQARCTTAGGSLTIAL